MESALAYKSREEMIGGRVVAMSSPTLTHIFIGANIYHMFRNYLRGKQCKAIPDGATLYLEEDREEYRPDMMVVCDRDKLKRKGVYGAPDLVVEILSPSTAKNDKGRKKDAYERHGVREYWLVDPVNKSVEQYALENGRFVLRDVYTQYTKEMPEDLTEDEKAALSTEFQCAIFEDFTVRLEDVFSTDM